MSKNHIESGSLVPPKSKAQPLSLVSRLINAVKILPAKVKSDETTAVKAHIGGHNIHIQPFEQAPRCTLWGDDKRSAQTSDPQSESRLDIS